MVIPSTSSLDDQSSSGSSLMGLTSTLNAYTPNPAAVNWSMNPVVTIHQP